MGAGGLPVHQAVAFDSGFLRVALALDDDPAILRPARGLAFGVVPEDLGEQPLQFGIGLELVLDLPEKLAGGRLVEAEDADRYLGIAQNLLDHPGECDET